MVSSIVPLVLMVTCLGGTILHFCIYWMSESVIKRDEERIVRFIFTWNLLNRSYILKNITFRESGCYLKYEF